VNSQWKFAAALVAAISLAAVQGPAFAQAAADKKGGTQEYQPQVGQSGKDVVWVPTPRRWSSACCGWRTSPPATTSSISARATAAPSSWRRRSSARPRWASSTTRHGRDLVKAAEKAGVSDKAKFIKADIFETDFSKATVITCTCSPR